MDDHRIRDVLRPLLDDTDVSSGEASELDEATLANKLFEIEEHIQTSKVEAKQALSKALVIIGQRNDRLNALALEVARRVGPIEIEGEDGDTVRAQAAELLRDPELAKRLLG